MDKNDLLKSVYEDFFGIGKLEKENEKLYRDIKKLKGIDIEGIEESMPSIEVNEEKRKTADIQNNVHGENEKLSKEEKDKLMDNSYKKIDELHLKNESKELLKKIIEYMRKYNEGVEKRFIAFNMCIYSENKESYESLKKEFTLPPEQ